LSVPGSSPALSGSKNSPQTSEVEQGCSHLAASAVMNADESTFFFTDGMLNKTKHN